MNASFARVVKVVGGAALALVTVQIAAVSLMRYVTQSQAPPPPILANGFADPYLAIHTVAGVVALLLGPLQLVPAIRARWPALHRVSGRIYVAACAVAAPTGLVLAAGTTAGPVAGAGFAMLGIVWAAFTGLGLRAVIGGRIAEHREWMIRSYAMAAAAITLRLMIPASFALGLDFLAAYRVIAWACWMVNLALVEYVIRRNRGRTSRFAALATA